MGISGKGVGKACWRSVPAPNHFDGRLGNGTVNGNQLQLLVTAAAMGKNGGLWPAIEGSVFVCGGWGNKARVCGVLARNYRSPILVYMPWSYWGLP